MRLATLLPVLTVLICPSIGSAIAARAGGHHVENAFLNVGAKTRDVGAKLKVLTSFKNLKGTDPLGTLLEDGAGNLYGTTYRGGTHNMGTVFELSPPVDQNKPWVETVLKSFDSSKGDYPCGGVIADGKGNLYGTTQIGGANNDGAVFKLSPPAGGKNVWKETVIQTFNGANGRVPCGSLVADFAGNLYGATQGGGEGGFDYGVVYELSPPNGHVTAWTETVLLSFNKVDGREPNGSLFLDSAGNLYGTTPEGGHQRAGVVFELSPPTKGQTDWTEKVLLTFDIANGFRPEDGLIADGAGNLFGVTSFGGTQNDGIVFELSPPKGRNSAWTETILLSFDGANGSEPVEGLITDGAGNLYGTTSKGGTTGDGLIFELSPPGGGQTAWTETVLQSFNGADGEAPLNTLTKDAAGNLYGTTSEGGRNNEGVAFELTP